MYVFQVFGDLVAAKMPNHKTTGPLDDRRDLVHRSDDDVAVVAVLRSGHLRRRARNAHLSGNVAASRGRQALLPDRQSDPLLRAANDSHISLLHSHMDQGMAQAYTHRHQRRPDGEITAEVEGEGGQDAGRGRHTLRSLVAASLRDLRRDQAGRQLYTGRRRNPANCYADRPVAGRQQFLHKSDPLRLFQQEVPARLHRHPQERSMLRQAQVLRDRRDDVLLDEHEKVLLLRQQQQQQFVDETRLARATGPPGQQRLLHIQPHRCVIAVVRAEGAPRWSRFIAQI